jgi:hypothetical protein
MNPVFTQLGLNTAIDYGKYQALKGNKGDYVDFLLHYDSVKAEDGDSSWMNSLLGTNDLTSTMSPQALAMMGGTQADALLGSSASANKDSGNSTLMMDAQVSALKLQLLDAFKQRYTETEKNETVKAAKIAALYAQADAVKIPTRLLG